MAVLVAGEKNKGGDAAALSVGVERGDGPVCMEVEGEELIWHRNLIGAKGTGGCDARSTIGLA